VRKKLMLFRQWVVCFAALAGYFFILIEFIRDPFFEGGSSIASVGACFGYSTLVSADKAVEGQTQGLRRTC